MTRSTLSRLAAPIAIGTGSLVVLTRLGTVATIAAASGDLRAAVASPLHAVNGIGSVVAYGLLIVAVVAIGERAAPGGGRLGALGLVGAIVGTVFMAGDWWYEGFALPWLAEVAPVVFETDLHGQLLIGGWSSFLLFSVGWMLYGVAMLRARAVPARIALGIVGGGLLSGVPIAGAYLVGGAILGAAIAWLGVWLRASAPVSDPGG